MQPRQAPFFLLLIVLFGIIILKSDDPLLSSINSTSILFDTGYFSSKDIEPGGKSPEHHQQPSHVENEEVKKDTYNEIKITINEQVNTTTEENNRQDIVGQQPDQQVDEESDIQITRGFWKLRNVCWINDKYQHGKMVIYLDKGMLDSIDKDNNVDIKNELKKKKYLDFKTYSKDRRNKVWLPVEVRNQDQYKNDLKKYGVWKEKTLFMLYIPNPAHCIQDILFSMFSEATDRKSVPYWPSYIYRHSKHPSSEEYGGTLCNIASWCCHITSLLDIFPQNKPEASVKYPNGGICFNEIDIPRFMEHRVLFRPSAQTNQSISIMHDVLIEKMDKLYSNELKQKKVQTNVLIYDRMDTTRRRWINANDFYKHFSMNYNLSTFNMMYYSKNWTEVSPVQQAKNFYLADLLVSPHGGSMANAMFMRKGTDMIEIHCTQNDMKMFQRNLNEKFPPFPPLYINDKWNPVWGAEESWFCWYGRANDIVASNFRYPHEKCEHYIRELVIDPAHLTHWINTRHLNRHFG